MTAVLIVGLLLIGLAVVIDWARDAKEFDTWKDEQGKHWRSGGPSRKGDR